jgi:hypothetical protein
MAWANLVKVQPITSGLSEAQPQAVVAVDVIRIFPVRLSETAQITVLI